MGLELKYEEEKKKTKKKFTKHVRTQIPINMGGIPKEIKTSNIETD
jgi:hypothetical protein